MATKLARIRQFGCVIEALPKDKGELPLSEEEFADALEKQSKVEGFRYWGILHYADKEEDGTIKRPHFHLVLETPTKHTTTGVVTMLASMFVVAENRVSVRQVKAFNMALRYLTHCDDEDKTPYLPNEVITNDLPALTYAYAQASDELDVETLINAVTECKGNSLLILRRLGVRTYSRYRNVIQDVARSLGLR